MSDTSASAQDRELELAHRKADTAYGKGYEDGYAQALAVLGAVGARALALEEAATRVECIADNVRHTARVAREQATPMRDGHARRKLWHRARREDEIVIRLVGAAKHLRAAIARTPLAPASKP